jgi:hypothetical protein
MTSTNETLFDLTPYGGDQTPRERRSALRSEASERSALPPVELLAPGWRLIRGRDGVLAFAHLVKATSTEGSVLTICNEWGTTLPHFDGDEGRRCPLCDMENQLH